MGDEGWRTDTAERPAVRLPTTPTPTAPNPSPDPSPGPPPATPTRASSPALPPAPPAADRPVHRPERQPAPAWIAWVVVAAVLVATALVGSYLVLRDTSVTSVTRATDPGPAGAAGTTEPPSEQPADEPVDEPAEEPSEEPVADPVELTSAATAVAPRAAPDNNDVTGELVTFTADNMLDGDPETSWRTAGDASGTVLTFTFATPVTVSTVGLVNGYAKSSVDDSGQVFDWYLGNRQVLSAEWLIEGQTFAQAYGATLEPQLLEIEPIQTSTVELRLTDVSAPSTGPNGRDYTAISDVRLTGSQ